MIQQIDGTFKEKYAKKAGDFNWKAEWRSTNGISHPNAEMLTPKGIGEEGDIII